MLSGRLLKVMGRIQNVEKYLLAKISCMKEFITRRFYLSIFCLFVSLSVCLRLSVWIYKNNFSNTKLCLSVCPSEFIKVIVVIHYISACLSVNVYVCTFIICLSVCLSVWIYRNNFSNTVSICLSVSVYVCTFNHLSVSLCMSVSQSFCLSVNVCLSVCLKNDKNSRHYHTISSIILATHELRHIYGGKNVIQLSMWSTSPLPSIWSKNCSWLLQLRH